MPGGHTDGDTIVYFVNDNVVHLGDHYFKDRFPYVDIDAGGTVGGLIVNIRQVLKPRVPIPGKRGDLMLNEVLEPICTIRAKSIVPSEECYCGTKAEAAGWPVLLAYLTVVPEDRVHGIAARAFKLAARRAGFAFLDTSPLFEGTEPLEQVIFRYDWHPNADSHARYARGIRDALQRNEMLAP